MNAKNKTVIAIVGILAIASLVVLYLREDIKEEITEELVIEGDSVLEKADRLVTPPDDDEFEPWKAPVTTPAVEAARAEEPPELPKELVAELRKQKDELATLAEKHCGKEEASSYMKFLDCMFPAGDVSAEQAKACFKSIDTTDPELMECEERVQEAKARKYCNDEEVKEVVALSRCLTKGSLHKLLLDEHFEEAEKVNEECMREFSISELSEPCLSGLMALPEEQQ
ncbi:MAG: hypothetical protein HYW48_05940 [Deltaproteobacteria bacterium]|nr:hypothetical protein [Deltaproteobacteria bacterium]